MSLPYRNWGFRHRRRGAPSAFNFAVPFANESLESTLTLQVAAMHGSSVDGHSTKAYGAILLRQGRLFPTNGDSSKSLAARTQKVSFDLTGVGTYTEVAVNLVGGGRWADGSYRQLHIVATVPATVPAYNKGAGAPGGKLAGKIEFGIARGTTDLVDSPFQYYEVAPTAGHRFGAAPAAARSDPRYAGTPDIWILNDDATYTSHIHAMLSDAEAQARPGDSGVKATRHAYFMSTYAIPQIEAFYAISTSTQYPSAQPTQSGSAPAGGWSANPQPAEYGQQRSAIGQQSGVGYGLHFYGRHSILANWFLQTGDMYAAMLGVSLLYWKVAFEKNWPVDDGVNPADLGADRAAPDARYGAISFTQLQEWKMVPEGCALIYALSGNPDILAWCEFMTGRSFEPFFGQNTGQAGNEMVNEARPLARVTDAVLESFFATRPAAEGSAGVSGIERHDWLTHAESTLVTVVTGTAFTNTTDPAPGWARKYWQSKWASMVFFVGGAPMTDTVSRIGWNNFMQPLVRRPLQRAINWFPFSGGNTQRTLLAQAILDSCTWQWNNEFCGAPAYDPLHPDNTGQNANFRNRYQQSNVPLDGTGAQDATMYDVQETAVEGIYLGCYYFLARITQSGAWMAVANIIRTNAYGTAEDGVKGPGMSGSPTSLLIIKQTSECLVYDDMVWADEEFGPAPTDIPNGTITQITLDQTTASVTVGATANVQSQARNATLIARPNSGLTVSTSNAAVATATVDTTTGVVTITGVGAGSANITVHNGAVSSAAIAVTAVAYVFFDTFTGVAIDATKQDNLSTGSGTLTVASSRVTVHGGGGSVGTGKMRSKPAFDLAGRAAIVKVVSASGDGDLIISLQDGSANGVGLRFPFGAFVNAGTVTGGSYSAATGSSSFSGPYQFRFTLSGGNIVIDQRATDGDSWSGYTSISAAGITTTALKFVVLADDAGGGTAQSVVVDEESVA